MIPTLRNYQEAQLAAIAGSLEQQVNRVLIKSPTGTGKTITFAAMLDHFEPWLEQFPRTERRMLVIAHREELLEQAAEKIRRANPGLLVAIEQGDRRASTYVDVIVASVQTLAAVGFRRLDRLLRKMTFRIVVVDEAHHAAARTYREILARCGFLPSIAGNDGGLALQVEAAAESDVAEMQRQLQGWDRIAPKDRVLVGFTATPNRSDGVGLGCVFQSIAYSYALKQAIADGWLVPPEPWVIETDTSLEDVHIRAGEFNQKELAAAVNTDHRNKLAVAGWREHAEGLPTLAFTVDVAHAHALAHEFKLAGYRAEAVSGDTRKEDRRLILAAYADGRLDIITNCMVLTEGTDLPRTGCILHAKPTQSATLYEQMTGRGLRLFEGKTKCVLLDVVDIARKHSLQTAPILYGLPPALIANGLTLEQLEAQLEALREEFQHVNIDEMLEDHVPLTLAQLRARALKVDPWAPKDLGAFGEGRQLQWTRVGLDEYQVEYPWVDAVGVEGFERVKVEKDMLERWDVVLTWFEKVDKGQRGERRQQTIGAGIVTMEAAASVAEGFVLMHRQSKARMLDVNATWSKRPATEKQMALLRRMRVPFNEVTLSAGQAGRLISQRQARWRSR